MELKKLKLALLAVMLPLLVSCSSNTEEMVRVKLGPVPYSIEVPGKIANRLSVENMLLDTSNEFTRQARAAGAIAQAYLNYRADDGTVRGFAAVYYFTKTDFDRAQNPEEPPIYGSRVVEERAMVLAIAGPQESIFDPNSEDGKNSLLLYKIVYDPKSYKLS